MRENWYRDVWLFAVTLLVVTALVAQGEVSRTNCHQIELVKSGLRGTLLEGERFARSSPVRSGAERKAIATFYADALAREKPQRC